MQDELFGCWPEPIEIMMAVPVIRYYLESFSICFANITAEIKTTKNSKLLVLIAHQPKTMATKNHTIGFLFRFFIPVFKKSKD
ncbi:hypothetical protein COW49_03150 [Candidatus Kaiserbacteria bacterium CG17_big_fil_post_rev_8_21_14_2_50_51_7]|uniref:Uncharacterized protein n=1 Tax=Candidatus Kaiserbacteria bacterium CG17_big_fil_post_rev_8_21_14_2_50_51_7 TaxID=1974613 RepID=A0A2M7FCZ2_9BACT|nr:MAG: hypothetical protein COW49_03150 [Candidatus Kaiserbacteria bacterium CG17_big_fil_post_rev_8_21_14_2_50_51_7]